jgi:threo-3-hydroxy-L-aspartate ammonia-lyase
MAVLSLDAVRSAAERVRPYVMRTPLLPIGDGRWLKLELLQPTGSFKVRGFFAAALSLPPERLSRGLLTVSAGNAAMACAHVASRLGVPSRVVMFDTAPARKVEGVRRWGGEPVQMPRQDLLDWLAGRGWESEPETFIHPFADEVLQAGHGGIGLEIAEQLPEVERVVVAVGGGGLVHGIASAVKAVRPGVEVLGVQSDGYELWRTTLSSGSPPAGLAPRTIADGTSAPYDESMHRALAASVDGWLTVPEPRLRSSIVELASAAKVVAEGAGALSFAALEQLAPGPPTVALISGGNADPGLLAELLGAG